ncbi:Regulator of telomere elongation helicase 1 like [Pseudolycoriella hygida]|uniref:Regulator of telomere elongation helicase 1 homolog n=1 Tax=Pseudolycoriella hygida TaxID=35572 RepID=A0A9Q0S0I8_9DIPT|nr:Regulator of telomere elongation helicase 1 like [Pseudolycoriella hygida]
MPEFNISGTSVSFPYEPYQLQRDYMTKVIECLNNSTNGVLESPTGTGKTLSLLCSTLGWITQKKSEISKEIQSKLSEGHLNQLKDLQTKNLPMLKQLASTYSNFIDDKPPSLGVPKVIYASRTHSQLAQAMQELKKTSYNGMKAAIIGSREQLCIHPDVMKEPSNSTKIHLCKLKLTTRTCSFYHKVESTKDRPEFREATVLDIEDLVVAGRKNKCCPYFMSKEMVENADIIFMPYNYLIDPMARKANKVELHNTIVILDEAHNMEKICEDSVSIQMTSSEIAVCIDDVTHLMKSMSEGLEIETDDKKDFTIDDLAILKEDLLNLEKAVDAIKMPNNQGGVTFEGSYIFTLLDEANITSGNFHAKTALLDSLVGFLSNIADKNAFFRRGAGLQKLLDMLNIVFSGSSDEYKQNVGRCFKVHVDVEQQKSKPTSTVRDGWIQTKASTMMNKTAKIVSFWCFSPNFGMQQLLLRNVRCIILTSGTLAPLKPLISELGIPVSVRLENPHIVTSSQVCVKVISQGPDKEPLLSNYENRDNPKYLTSLGRTILSLCNVIPNGLLVFFTSYFILNKCRDTWQASGIWAQIHRVKAIFVEPQTKEAFVQTMKEYYDKVNDSTCKGAVFLAVCRGKVSEGLDFADMNGRAVIITGLPFPPLKDPRVILKKKYLQDNRNKENEMLSGDDWYFLEATRAVNQAIGRVIRHKNDYGAILLCDQRFNQQRQKSQLSSWIQGHLKAPQHNSFGPLIAEISRFFRNAERTLPVAQLKPLLPCDIDGGYGLQPSSSTSIASQNTVTYRPSVKIKKEEPDEVPSAYSAYSFESKVYEQPIKTEKNITSSSTFFTGLNTQVKTINFNSVSNEPTTPLVTLHKRERTSPARADDSPGRSAPSVKKRKFKIVANDSHTSPDESANTSISKPDIEPSAPESIKELMTLLKSTLSPSSYLTLCKALTEYQHKKSFENLFEVLVTLFQNKCLHYLLKGMKRFLLPSHKEQFDERILNYLS